MPNTPPIQPPIQPRTVAAMVADDYIGMPALDDPTWEGATDSSRSMVHEDWCFCHDDETERTEAINGEGEGWYSTGHGWEQY